MKKKLCTIASGVLLALTIAGPAVAHVTVQPNEAIAESFSRFVVRVPNERDNANTTKIEVKFPPMAFVSFASEDPPGWDRDVEMRKLKNPLEAFGEKLSEVVGTVTWSGGEIEPSEFAEFSFSAAMPAGENDLEFPALQTYSNGEIVRWTGPEDAETPAALVSTVELGDLGEGLGELGTLHEVVHEVEEIDGKVDELELASGGGGGDSEESDDGGDEEGDDTLPIVLGGAGAALGLIALIVTLTRRRA